MTQKKWDTDSIKRGIDKFYSEHGRYPITPEVDQCDYLPSSRQIQRRFGGMEKLREELGYSVTSYGRGDHRKHISLRTGERGRKAEIVLEKILREKFGEVFVHSERMFGKLKTRVDFYVYSPDGNFGIDVFDTGTMRDLQKNINIKIEKYREFTEPLYFVVANKDFTQFELDEYISKKKKNLLTNMQVCTTNSLVKAIEVMRVYPDPLTTN